MTLRTGPHLTLRRSALAAAGVLAGCCTSAAGAPSSAQTLAVPMPAVAGGGAGVAALMHALREASAQQHRGAQPAGAATRHVTSCADDGGSGTLRAVLASAASGDTIELAGLACSTITLAQGAIPVVADSVTIHGPGASRLAIDGAAKDRVFVHYGLGTFTVSNLAVRNGFNYVADYHIAGGACILGNTYVTLDHAAVTDCTAIGEGAYGGAILTHGVTLYTSAISGSTAQGNRLKTLTASYGGGAFAYRGTAALYDSVVSGNRAVIDPASRFGSYDTGAGVFTDLGGYARGSTVSGNYTDGTGGGIASHAPFFVTNSTISGNTARKAGGGIFLRTSYGASVRNSTITGNSADAGGGIYFNGNPANLRLESTIVAGNAASAGADIASKSPLAVAGANNLVGAAAPDVALPSDTLHGDPRLLPLANNGGPTPTHALSTGSPAIDRGNNTENLATDQRGPAFPRVVGAAPDIGAFEFAPRPAAAATPAPAFSPAGIAGLVAVLAALGLRRLRRRT